MQIKIFSIPIPFGEVVNEDMNKFLRSKQVLDVDQHVVSGSHGSYWCFSIRYLDEAATRERGNKVDYREVLDEPTFKRFSQLREIRKVLAAEEGVPPFVVFSDEELAALAQTAPPLTAASMKNIKGIGDKKMEKYASKVVNMLENAQQ